MMGTRASHQEQPLFSYHIQLEQRVPADHPLRQLQAALDLSFVPPAVKDCYGRSGHVSLDPRVVVKMMLLLFYYNIPSERELMAQIAVRLDFLWFLGFDLDTPIPDHSVPSKARARWGDDVFQQLFARTVQQCVAAGLVDGRLLHLDSTIIKANASKNSVLQTSPEMVQALRQAYEQQAAKLEVLATPEPAESESALPPGVAPFEPSSATVEQPNPAMEEPSATIEQPDPAAQKAGGKKLPANQTHISLTDPQARLARCKNGTTDLTYKEHRAVDDAYGVITAVQTTISTAPDARQLPALVQEHQHRTGLASAALTLAGDGHYGTAESYLYCAAQNWRPHLAEVSANVQGRGQFPASEFTYEAAGDRYRCPQGHYLTFHQHKPEEQARVYLIEDRALCAACPLRDQCTSAKAGRSLKRHVQADLLARAQKEAHSPAARYSRKRRKHVMEGSFADAANNHGSKRARWRGLARQQLQSWLIAACQNLRRLVRHARRRLFPSGAVGTVVEVFSEMTRMAVGSPAMQSTGAPGQPFGPLGTLALHTNS